MTSISKNVWQIIKRQISPLTFFQCLFFFLRQLGKSYSLLPFLRRYFWYVWRWLWNCLFNFFIFNWLFLFVSTCWLNHWYLIFWAWLDWGTCGIFVWYFWFVVGWGSFKSFRTTSHYTIFTNELPNRIK